MANVWVGTDYYIPEIDQSGDVINVSFASTTTSNTYNYIVSKNETPPNPESVGAATIVWLNGEFWQSRYWYKPSSDDSRRITMTPSSTASANGTGLVTELAISANGYPHHIYADNLDVVNGSSNVANLKTYHVVAGQGGTGWEEQDNVSFTNVDGGYQGEDNTAVSYNFIGNVIWTDKNGPGFYDGAPEVSIASNATFYVNCAIRAGTWTP